jgi:hypothetical protein
MECCNRCHRYADEYVDCRTCPCHRPAPTENRESGGKNIAGEDLYVGDLLYRAEDNKLYKVRPSESVEKDKQQDQ